MGSVPAALNAELRERFGTSISKSDAEQVCAEILGGGDGQGHNRMTI